MQQDWLYSFVLCNLRPRASSLHQTARISREGAQMTQLTNLYKLVACSDAWSSSIGDGKADSICPSTTTLAIYGFIVQTRDTGKLKLTRLQVCWFLATTSSWLTILKSGRAVVAKLFKGQRSEGGRIGLD